jgi:hypothetical protein
MQPVARLVTGFFTQFTARCIQWRFALINLACGKLQKNLPQRVAELPFE